VTEEIFSGSIVFDESNTNGFGTETTPPLVAIYTSAYRQGSAHAGIQAQSLTLQPGRRLQHTGYPVLTRGSADFRDPKVIRYHGETESYWVMVSVEAQDFQVVLYKSHDLKNWELLSTFGPANATGEGPQDPDRLAEYQWLDWGRDYYTAVSFNDAPDNRRLMIGWMNNWQYANRIPTAPWRKTLRSTPRQAKFPMANMSWTVRPAASKASTSASRREGPGNSGLLSAKTERRDPHRHPAHGRPHRRRPPGIRAYRLPRILRLHRQRPDPNDKRVLRTDHLCGPVLRGSLRPERPGHLDRIDFPSRPQHRGLSLRHRGHSNYK
jgi:hypothetical protein